MNFDLYEQMKVFLNFREADVANLKAMAPTMEAHQGQITDYFYKILMETPETAKFVEGRVDHLKATHKQWFKGLFAGDYGPTYFESRWKIGTVHVRIGLDPFWVEGVMNIIRRLSLESLAGHEKDPLQLAMKHASLLKILDLDLFIINLSYNEDRLSRITDFTGMKRSLIENIIRLPKK